MSNCLRDDTAVAHVLLTLVRPKLKFPLCVCCVGLLLCKLLIKLYLARTLHPVRIRSWGHGDSRLSRGL